MPPTKGGPLKSWSITGRLAVLYTISAIITLFSVSLLFDWSLRDSVTREQSEFLNDRLRTYRSIIEAQPDHLRIVRNDIEWEGAYVSHPEYYARVLDEQGRTLVETPGMSEVLPPSVFPSPFVEGRQGDVTRQGGNDRTFLIKAGVTSRISGGNNNRIIQIGLDVTSGQLLLKEKEEGLVIFFFLGILLATGVGVVVARQALRPLDEITRVAEDMTIARMNTRTEPERWPGELRSLAVAFNGMLERLEGSFHRMSQVSSNLAHELRTPVTNLMAEAEVILSRERTAEEYRRTIESGVEEYRRLSRIINGMLFIARAENPANHLKAVHFDPMAEIAKVCSFYEAVAEEHDAVITSHGSGQLFGDPLMFNRAISNLLANALHYSAAGVRIHCGVATGADGSVHVTVTDSGYGISREELSHIFDRFFRGEKMRAVNPEGSGLGLAIVTSIVELHGGTIAIDSTPGHGTTVTLTFPAIPPL